MKAIIENNRLLFNKPIVGGLALESEIDKYFEIYSPGDGALIGSIPSLSAEQVEYAIENSQQAFLKWKNYSIKERCDLLLNWHSNIIANLEELAQIITLEQGKTLKCARAEVIYGANFIKWFALQALNLSAEAINVNGLTVLNSHEPMGVIGAITPWNFPNAMIARKVAPALAAGCCVVLKPSEVTPFSAIALARLAMISGIPDGAMNIITADAMMAGDILTSHELVKKITFTGSVKIGKLLYEKAASHLKPVALELGGNAPCIVCEDADLELATQKIIAAKIRSNGQACTAVNRLFVHQKVYGPLMDILCEKFNNLKIGSGFDEDVDLGPLINKYAAMRVYKFIEEAVNDGAEMLCGSKAQGESFVSPTLLVHNNQNLRIFKEEIFAPVLGVMQFSCYEEMLKMANSTKYGLSAYVFTQDHGRIKYMQRMLDFGMVGVNETMISNEYGAFSGRKNSGFGVEGSKYGIFEFMHTKYICEG